MLQNRVDPQGNIIRTPARGAWMGNRGLIHDESKNIIRSFKLKAWLICRLSFKGRRREVMTPNLYTELFFLDEATAFAAGHRPCFECRREEAEHFKDCWIRGNAAFGFTKKTKIAEIDNILHKERIDKKGVKIIHEEDAAKLPPGTFVLLEGKPFLLAQNFLYEWHPGGYTGKIELPVLSKIRVLTPLSTVNAFRAGYRPQCALSSI